jgi:beta-glucosidase
VPSQLPVAVKSRLVAGASDYATLALPALGLQSLRLADGGHGIGGFQFDETTVALCLPCGTAQAATWDSGVVYALGALIGSEARRLGVDVVLAPMINIPRSPLGGRAFECYGEDPLLAGVLASAWIRGVQSTGVAATPKHFVGNDAERARTRVDCVIDERALREIYLLPFELAARAGAWACMAAYNQVNGVPCCEHTQLLTEVLKGEWAWDGLVMSDWLAARKTVPCALAGTDLEMPGPPRVYGAALADAVAEGRVGEQRLDDMLERLLRLAARVGRLGADRRRPPPPVPRDARALLRDACADALVLLRNRGQTLPLVRGAARTIAVIGPCATEPCLQGGGSSRVNMAVAPTPLDCIIDAYADDAEVVHEPGCSRRTGPTPLYELGVCSEQFGDRPGLTVEYFRAGEDEPFARELRAASRLLWHNGIPGMSTPGGQVRVVCQFVPTSDGDHRFTVKASGSARLLVSGHEAIRTAGISDPQDAFAVLFSDNTAWSDVRLRRELPVRIEIRMVVSYPDALNLLELGCRPPDAPCGLEDAVAAAAQSDAAILMVGTGEDLEREGADRANLRLPGRQEELGRRVIAANPRTIAIVNAGSQIDLRWARGAAALLYAWLPGQEFGPALADVLCGEREPGGRLPITLGASATDYAVLDTTPGPDLRRSYAESTLVGYRSFDARRIEPEFCFGHGLGYTDFAYEAMRLSEFRLDADQPLTVAVTVRNVGASTGKEVLQVYVAPPSSAVQRPPRELKGFTTVRLGPGQAGTAELELDKRAFAHWDVDAGAWTVLSGSYDVEVGRSSRDIRLRARVSTGYLAWSDRTSAD